MQSSKRHLARGGARRLVYATTHLDLRLHILDCVARFHLKGDCLPCEGLDKDLHGAALLSAPATLTNTLLADGRNFVTFR